MFEEVKHKLNNLQLNERLLGLQSAQTDDQRTLYYVENSQKSRNLQRRQIVCNLCLAEKYFIIRYRGKNLLNSRTELLSKCRHRKKFFYLTGQYNFDFCSNNKLVLQRSNIINEQFFG